jgi:CheY-like chemotaxis protein
VADPGAVEQILMNLVVNARDALEGGGTVTVRTRPPAAAGDRAATADSPTRLLLEVEDDGVGMDAHTQAHIYDPFFTTKPPGRGTGLGLSTVYGLVEQSGGSIQVRSQPGQGTRFRVYLPASAEEPTAETATPTTRTNGSGAVLLVEDDDNVRAVARRCLESAGVTVWEAVDGRHARRVFAKHHSRIDLVVTDMVMPDLGGADLVRGLRRELPDLPALFMSGYAWDDPAVQDGLPPEAAFLQKPFTPAELVSRVLEMLAATPPDQA